SGALQWRTQVGEIRVGIPAGDVDGDNKYEVIIGNNSGYTCLNAENGSVLWTSAPSSGGRSIYLADADMDGCVEIVGGSTGYNIYVLDDPGNSSGCMSVGEHEGPGGYSLEFRPLSCGLYLFLPSHMQVSLSLYDAQGRLVQNLYEGLLSPGGHTFIPKAEGKSVYLAVLRYPGGIKTAKMIR
ncbi:MAG: hypothetical protein ABIM19_02745, partial [candidate division WOR-3 bacterium]